MPVGEKITEELLCQGAYELVELQLVKMKLTHNTMRTLTNCNLSKLLTLTLKAAQLNCEVVSLLAANLNNLKRLNL